MTLLLSVPWRILTLQFAVECYDVLVERVAGVKVFLIGEAILGYGSQTRLPRLVDRGDLTKLLLRVSESGGDGVIDGICEVGLGSMLVCEGTASDDKSTFSSRML